MRLSRVAIVPWQVSVPTSHFCSQLHQHATADGETTRSQLSTIQHHSAPLVCAFSPEQCHVQPGLCEICPHQGCVCAPCAKEVFPDKGSCPVCRTESWMQSQKRESVGIQRPYLPISCFELHGVAQASACNV